MDITFVLETGTGITGATSYVDITELKQYFFDNEYDFDSLTDIDIQRLANKATLYIDSNYQSSWPGYVQTEDQALLWPRSSGYYLTGYEIAEDTIPKEVKDAVCEMGYMISSGINPFETIEKSGKILKESSKVDVISESFTYEEGSTLYQDLYTKIDSILAKITGGISSNFALKLIRVGGESP